MGAGANFDGPDSDAVRKLVLDNAAMWIRDFHIDGLRWTRCRPFMTRAHCISGGSAKKPCRGWPVGKADASS